MSNTPMITWKDMLPVADKLRLQIYRDATDVTYDYEYYCYALPHKLLANYAWSIERLQYNKAGDLLARHYSFSAGDTSVLFKYPATDLATVKALPYQTG